MTLITDLALYLKYREGDFLVYSEDDDCDVVDVSKLEKIIAQYVRGDK